MSHTSPWTQQQQQQQQQQIPDSRGSSPMPGLPQSQQPYNLQSNNAILTPPSSAGNSMGINNDILGGLQLGLNGRDDASKQAFGSGSMDDAQFLVPISNPRSRSKSETTMQRPSWQMGSGFDMQQGASIPVGTQQDQQPQQMQTPQLSHMPASFGPPATDNIPSQFGSSGDLLSGSISNNNFLSPDHALAGIGASDLRRARSEGHGHKRNALSADMTPIFADQSSNLLYPSQAGFRFGGQSSSGNFLTAGGMGASVPSAAGAHRRTMSGGSGHGYSRSLSRDRVSLGTSPYPSPHASPRTNTQLPLPDPFGSNAYGPGGTVSGPGAPTVHVMSHDAQGRPTVQSQQPISVARQNVTTHATADASQRRRRTEANFACPVPGCGSTFTRHFNLKGEHHRFLPSKCCS